MTREYYKTDALPRRGSQLVPPASLNVVKHDQNATSFYVVLDFGRPSQEMVSGLAFFADWSLVVRRVLDAGSRATAVLADHRFGTVFHIWTYEDIVQAHATAKDGAIQSRASHCARRSVTELTPSLNTLIASGWLVAFALPIYAGATSPRSLLCDLRPDPKPKD